MGNYADVKDAMDGRKNKGNNYQNDPTKVTYIDDVYNPDTLAEMQKNDPYGTNSTGNAGTSRSFRQRGDVTQKRVNTDTRVRNEANSGTAGAKGKGQGSSMQNALEISNTQEQATPAQQGVPQNAAWQATRQAVDLQSVRGRLMSGLKSNGRQ